MNELDSEVNADIPEHDQQLAIAAGNMLRDAREAKGLTVVALAAALKVSVKKIEAIEADRFDLLPDMVFARALAFSICRNLKIDSSPILEKFPPTVPANLKNDESGINTPFRAAQDVSRFRVFHTVSRPVVIFFILLLLLLVLAVYAYPFINTSKLEGIASESISKINFPTQTEDKSILQSVRTAVPLPGEGIILSPSYPAVSNGILIPERVAVTGKIIFKSRNSSWVEVVDAQGIVQMRKILIAGEVVGVSGALPLAVVVGKADSLDVSVAGKPFNLIEFTKDNVARFEVN